LTPYPGKEVMRERSVATEHVGSICTPQNIEERLLTLLADAAASGLTVEVVQQPLHPLAMGHYRDHIVVRESREMVKMIMERPNPKKEAA